MRMRNWLSQMTSRLGFGARNLWRRFLEDNLIEACAAVRVGGTCRE